MAKRRRKKLGLFNKYIITLLIIILVGAFIVERNKSFIYRIFHKTEQKSRPYSFYQNFFNEYTVFGIDVSLYQGKIDWSKLSTKQEVDFVFIRATAGNNRLDSRFDYNWQNAKKYNIIRGAYHYYRPNENSNEQAQKFISNVSLEHGDLPPVLDIEEYSKVQSIRSLKNGLLNWLNIVEDHYGITPILYTYNRFYLNLFANDSRFDKYPVWIAWYNIKRNPNEIMDTWHFWQFTDKGTIKGVEGYIDINIYNGSNDDLLKLLLE